MRTPLLLMIVSALLLPTQHVAAAPKDTKKPTPTKDVTKKTTDKRTTTKKTPSKTTTKTTPSKTTTPSKKTTPSKTTTPAKKSTTTKKTASHISIATPELQKKAAAWVKALPSTQRSKLLALLNKGKLEDFKEYPGVGPAKFENMKKGRPYKTVDALANINGFGEKTFKAVVDHAKKVK